MSVGTVSPYSNSIAFQGANKENKKHPIKAVMSAVIPGTGQVLNGDIFKGVGYMSVASAVDGLTGFLTGIAFIASKSGAKNPIALIGAAATSALASLFVHFSSAKDAYRGGRKD